MTENRVDDFLADPHRALFRLALPIVVGMLVQTLYNIVDTAFIGRLGAESIAALTFSFPLFFILIAVNAGITFGMTSCISRHLGAKQKLEAENAAIHGLVLGLGVAVVISAVGISFLEEMFALLGATDNVVALGVDYMSIMLFAIVFMFPAYVFNSIFTAQGDTKTPMKVQITALVVNIILDPIFIYVLGFGVRGAAMASAISMFVALVMAFGYVRTRSYLKLEPRAFRFSSRMLKGILSVGAPASVTMLLMSLYFMFINRFMAHFGVEYVAAFGLSARLEQVSTMPIVALSTAMLTLVGMFYGAKRYDALRDIVGYGMKASIAFASGIGALLFIFAPPSLRVFTSDLQLITLGSAYLRVIVFQLPLVAITMLTARTMQGMGLGFPGLVINVLRTLIVGIPLAYLFVFHIGYTYLSIAAAIVLGALASSLLALPWLWYKFRQLERISS